MGTKSGDIWAQIRAHIQTFGATLFFRHALAEESTSTGRERERESASAAAKKPRKFQILRQNKPQNGHFSAVSGPKIRGVRRSRRFWCPWVASYLIFWSKIDFFCRIFFFLLSTLSLSLEFNGHSLRCCRHLARSLARSLSSPNSGTSI